MTTHRIFWPDLTNEQLALHKSPQQLSIIGNEAHHALKVKRLKVGEKLELLNGAGLIAKCRISEIAGKILNVVIMKHSIIPQPLTRITIAAPPPKGPGADHMVNQLSQLGVTEWVPLQTRRTIVKPSVSKIEKWQRAAIESAKQCGRPWIMNIQKPLSLTPFMDQRNRNNNNCDSTSLPELIFVADARGPSPHSFFPKPKQQEISRYNYITLIVGPEGGFTEDEYNSLIAREANPIRLAPHILRIETAAMTGAAFCTFLAMQNLQNPQ